MEEEQVEEEVEEVEERQERPAGADIMRLSSSMSYGKRRSRYGSQKVGRTCMSRETSLLSSSDSFFRLWFSCRTDSSFRLTSSLSYLSCEYFLFLSSNWASLVSPPGRDKAPRTEGFVSPAGTACQGSV